MSAAVELGLEAALDTFGIDVTGKVAVDVGPPPAD